MAEPEGAKVVNIVTRVLNAAWVRPFLFLIFIVVLWDLTIRVFRIPAYQIPSPGDVVAVLKTEWPELLRQSWPTTYATICGFLLSALFGIPVAMLIAGSKTVESYVYPLLVFSQSVPKIAIAPLFVVWFGFGIIPKVISAFLLGFFPVVVSAVQGFKSVDPDMVDLARAMQGSRFQVFRAVNLPHAMPAIFAGLKVSVTLAVVGAVVGEFVGSNSGIGYVMQRSIGTFDLPTMFAALVILALLGVILFWIVDRIERLVIPWHVSQREESFSRREGYQCNRHCESEATKQSSFLVAAKLDCFASLAMTKRKQGRRHMMKWILAAAAMLAFTAQAVGRRQGRADAELVCLWRARAVLLRQGQGHLCRRRHRSRNPGRPRLGRDHAGRGRQDRRFRLCRRAHHDARGDQGRARRRHRRAAADQPDVGDGLCREEHQEARGHQGQDGGDHAGRIP